MTEPSAEAREQAAQLLGEHIHDPESVCPPCDYGENVARALTEKDAAVAEAWRQLATMTPTEAYDTIYRALELAEAKLVEVRAHSDGADEAAAEALRQRDDARAKLAEAERERDVLRITCDAHIVVIGDLEADLAAIREALREAVHPAYGAMREIARNQAKGDM